MLGEGRSRDLNSDVLRRQTTFTPGFYKIFDEILVNAADNKVRFSIKIDLS